MNLDELKRAARQFRAGRPLDGANVMSEFTNKSDNELAELIRRAAMDDVEAVIANNFRPFALDSLRVRLRKENIEFKTETIRNPAMGEVGIKVFLKRPEPPGADGIKDHDDNCDCVIAEGIYDTEKCELCRQITKVINLLRRNTKNGASQNEEDVAKRMAAKIMDQHGILEGDIVDRRYAESKPQQATYAPIPQDPVWGPRYHQPRYSPPPPRPARTQPASNAPNFSSAAPPAGSRMRANYPKGGIRHKKGTPIDSIG